MGLVRETLAKPLESKFDKGLNIEQLTLAHVEILGIVGLGSSGLAEAAGLVVGMSD